MKKTLLTIAIAMLSLTACIETSSTATASSPDSSVRVMAVIQHSDLGYTLRKVCVDGIAYMTYGETLTEQRLPNGLPRTCQN